MQNMNIPPSITPNSETDCHLILDELLSLMNISKYEEIDCKTLFDFLVLHFPFTPIEQQKLQSSILKSGTDQKTQYLDMINFLNNNQDIQHVISKHLNQVLPNTHPHSHTYIHTNIEQ